MTCPTENHQSRTTPFCPDCGAKLQDNFIEKFNKELLPLLYEHRHNWYNYHDGILKIYEFIIANNLKLPKRVFFDIEKRCFTLDDYTNGAEFKLYNDKLLKTCKESPDSILGVDWLFWTYTGKFPIFEEIKLLESKFDVPVPDNVYYHGSCKIVDDIDAHVNIPQYKDNKEVVKEYLISVIRKM